MSGSSLPLNNGVLLRLGMPCEVAAVRPAAAQVREFLERQGFSPDECAGCELALCEACNNAVRYVSVEGGRWPVMVEVAVEAGRVELRVADHTGGFEWPEVVELPDERSENGRGLFLMVSLMDEVGYFRGRGGNVLVMSKQRAVPRAESAMRAEERVKELEARLQEDERVIRDMAEELSSCYESLAAIFRYSGEQSREDSIHEFAQRLLTDLLRVTGNEWYVFRLLQPGGRSLAVFASSLPDVEMGPIELPAEPGPEDVLEVQAASGHRDVCFEHAGELRPGDPLARFGAAVAGLVHAVYIGETFVGTLAVGGAAGGGRFTAARMSVVQTFADFLAIQVVNARLQAERERGLLVAQELQIARQIQRSLLPAVMPEVSGVELSGVCDSANEVGGDFFDVVPLTDTSAMVVVADVMGKGLPAAMFALVLRSLVRALRDLGPEPGRLLERANRLLYEELSRVEMFITAQVAYVDRGARRLVLASAGHCPALVAQGAAGPVQSVSPDGMPLGVLADVVYEEAVFEITPHSRCLMYTDGLTEAVSPARGEMFGQSRLTSWFAGRAAAGVGTGRMREELGELLLVFRGGQPPRDDQTFVIIGGRGPWD